MDLLTEKLALRSSDNRREGDEGRGDLGREERLNFVGDPRGLVFLKMMAAANVLSKMGVPKSGL